MSKIHSKVSSIKLAALTSIGVGIVAVLFQVYSSVHAIISSQDQLEEAVDPTTIQQQNIRKAYDLILSQTVEIEIK